MKRFILAVCCAVCVCGCATYKFKRGEGRYEGGIVVSRAGTLIPEYTAGKEAAAPDLAVAKERFKRRRKTVESYYKKMGVLHSRFYEYVLNPPIFGIKMVGGVLSLPLYALADYRYEHNPAYRAKVQQRELAQELREEKRVGALKSELGRYIEKDLLIEQSLAGAAQPAAASEAPVAQPAAAPEAPVAQPTAVPSGGTHMVTPDQKEQVEEAALAAAAKAAPPSETSMTSQSGITAFIVAKPTKGLSPLTVRFSATKSRSAAGKIVAYSWDFGDGDTSTSPHPVNTYISTTYGGREFPVTLTVKDVKGNTATAAATILVLTK